MAVSGAPSNYIANSHSGFIMRLAESVIFWGQSMLNTAPATKHIITVAKATSVAIIDVDSGWLHDAVVN